MKTVSANKAKRSLGGVIDEVQREPLVIQRYKRDATVLLSVRDYERLASLNVREFQRYCDCIGKRAKERGLTERKLKDILDAEGQEANRSRYEDPDQRLADRGVGAGRSREAGE